MSRLRPSLRLGQEHEQRAAVEPAASLRVRGVEDRSARGRRWRRGGVDARRAARPAREARAALAPTARRRAPCPPGTRCSPWKKPLSEVKTISVRSSSPAARSAATIAATPSSTASSDSSALPVVLGDRRRSAPASSVGRLRILAGLSDDVRLVERGRHRQWLGGEAILVPRGRDGRRLARRVVRARVGRRCAARGRRRRGRTAAPAARAAGRGRRPSACRRPPGTSPDRCRTSTGFPFSFSV